MDRGVRDRIVNGRVGMGAALVLLALLAVSAGCNRYAAAPPPMPSPASEDLEAARPDAREDRDASPAAVPVWLPPAVAVNGTGKGADVLPGDNAAVDLSAAENAAIDKTTTEYATNGNTVAGGMETAVPAASAPPAAKEEPGVPPAAENGRSAAPPSNPKPKPADAATPVPAAAMDPRGASPPEWTKRGEELVYRVDFVGITMGYARFRYDGKVSIAGKAAYHLNVRAWTSGVLSFIYPINDTIDYYLDAETLAPIRQEFTHTEREKDDVALYNQDTGRITYRYRQSGKIRKQFDAVPPVYDPVSVAYYFRWRDLGFENRPRNMYGGRKLYQISSRVLGYERIRTDHGEVDTIAVVPVIRRDGKPDNKGDLKIWFSNDERRVPVRLYAKFRKIKEWTLVGELVPPTGKAGG